MKLKILYEDNHTVCVIKPQGVLSQGDGSGAPDMLSVLKEDIKERYGKPGNVFVGLIHRLDRNVGGTMVFAKTSKGASRLSEEMRDGTFFKGYFAFTYGKMSENEGFLKHKLLKNEKTNTVVQSKDGKECILYYQKVCEAGGISSYFVIPVTGRTHQIRAQFAFSGAPLLEENKYARSNSPGAALGLWSAVVSFKKATPDEKTGVREQITVKSLPEGINFTGETKAELNAKLGDFLENFDMEYYRRCINGKI